MSKIQQIHNNFLTATNINDFTDDEIREQLHYLGFKNISQEKFLQFKKDLEKLISKDITLNSDDTSANNNVNYIINNQSNLILKTRQANKSPQLFVSNKSNATSGNKRVTFPNDSQIVKSFVDEFHADEENKRGIAEQNDNDELDQSFASITTTTSSIVDNKVIKRKVVRLVFVYFTI